MKQNAPKPVPVISDRGACHANRKKLIWIPNPNSVNAEYLILYESEFVIREAFFYSRDTRRGLKSRQRVLERFVSLRKIMIYD